MKTTLKRIVMPALAVLTVMGALFPQSIQAIEYKEIPALAADNAEGTLDFSDAGSGTYKMTYTLNGKEVSCTLPDSMQMRNGPLGGTDDLGRQLLNEFSEVDPDYTVATDDWHAELIDEKTRTVGVYGSTGEHYVGIFYFLWLSPGMARKGRNITEILEEYGKQAKDGTLEVWGSVYDTFFFAEPLYGYYVSSDKWVVRKHMELLSNAGIDFLYFDTTNNYIYQDVVKVIREVCHEMNEEGIKAPKMVFYTHTDANIRVREIYKAIYKSGEYQDTWFYLDGKPLIIAPQESNIDGFFTIREPQWPNEQKADNTWPWIDWHWPQELYGPADNEPEAISVSVAQHSGNGEFSSWMYGYKNNRGRSFDGTDENHTEDSYKLGLNIQRQFNYAYVKGSKYILVTGWNEWIAFRQPQDKSKYAVRFIDTFNYEFSRDIEMSKGGYFDNYYMQLVANVAMLKGAVPSILRDDRHLINVKGDFSQWDAVKHSYGDPYGDNEDRKSKGSMVGTKYTDESGRNDIVSVKVTNDATWMHFMIECAADIEGFDGNGSWLQVLLDTDSSVSTGWLGYDYIANFAPSEGHTTLARYSGASGEYAFENAAEIQYKVSGSKFMMSVPLEAMGIEYINKINLQFKVCDSRTEYTTCEQFYTEGDCAPLGRPNFVYQTYFPEVSEVAPIKTVKVDERAEKLLNDDSMKAGPVEKPGGEKKNSCGGTVSLTGALFVLILAAAVCTGARKKTGKD